MALDFGNINSKVLGGGPVDPRTGLSFEGVEEDLGSVQTPQGTETSLVKEKFAKYTGMVIPAFGEEYYKPMRAQEQSRAAQFGAFLNQAIIGEIAGGTIEGIGNLISLQ